MTRGGVAGLLLAAGAGRRFGGPKALAVYRGRLFVEAAVDVLRAGGCDPVVVVLGASADEVRGRADLAGCVVVDNGDWAEGMGSSLRAGLAALAPRDGSGDGRDIVACVVLPVDVPGVTPAAVRRVSAAAGPEALTRASYDGTPGHPVLIGRAHWPEVAASARGDVGARDYLRAHPVLDVPCGDVASGEDVDTVEDLNRLSDEEPPPTHR